jgi:hypothetical protein
MQYKNFIDNLKKHISDNLPANLTALKTKYTDVTITNPDLYVISEYPDCDKYSQGIVVYLITPEFEFEELSNESKALECTLELYVTFQKQKMEQLKNLAAIYAEAIFNLIKDDPSFGSKVDYSMISRVKIYDGVEGSTSTKAIFINVKMLMEA